VANAIFAQHQNCRGMRLKLTRLYKVYTHRRRHIRSLIVLGRVIHLLEKLGDRLHHGRQHFLAFSGHGLANRHTKTRDHNVSSERKMAEAPLLGESGKARDRDTASIPTSPPRTSGYGCTASLASLPRNKLRPKDGTVLVPADAPNARVNGTVNNRSWACIAGYLHHAVGSTLSLSRSTCWSNTGMCAGVAGFPHIGPSLL
jgi:hypothetical protein